jgi:hypothetical protein
VLTKNSKIKKYLLFSSAIKRPLETSFFISRIAVWVVTLLYKIEMFRGEFVELNGGADFYAKDIESLNQWIVDTLDHAAHI